MDRGCTQCGECLNVCPVFLQTGREEHSPKGKRLLLEPLQPGYPSQVGELPWTLVRDLARMCAGCGRCARVCARSLSVADLLARVRAGHPDWTGYLWEIWIRRLGPLWPGLGSLASLFPRDQLPKNLKAYAATACGLKERPVPPPVARLIAGPAEPAGKERKVVVFQGCTGSRVRPDWGKKAVEILKGLGITVVEQADFTCCGATLTHAGRPDAAARLRRHNLEVWKDLDRPRVAVICASCYQGLKDYPPETEDPVQGWGWHDSVLPLSALLEDCKVEQKENAEVRIGYHQPCHWGNQDPDLPLLLRLYARFHSGSAPCCGMGGILKLTHPLLSQQMAETCLEGFSQEMDMVVSGCGGCVIQLGSVAPKRMAIGHWLDTLDL